MLNDGVPHNVIAAKIDEIVLSKMDVLTGELQDYIYTDELSLPEKRAALAQLLGEDDALLSGQQFNKEQLEMDDCSEEVMEFLIDANNRLLNQTSLDIPAQVFPGHLQLADYAAFSDKSGEPVAFGLKELKKLRVDIRRDSEYIRKRQAELDRLEQNLQDIKEERKVLKDGGFEYGGTIFKVVEDIEQRPFEQTYVPLGNLGVTSADLRSSFTSIKSQGQVGACASFAFTSVFEYILNKNGKLTESDLSERFLYYNTRKRMGAIDKDSGSNMYDAGKALEEEGLCAEELCKYVNDFEAPLLPPLQRPLYSKGPVIIEDDVWLGEKVSVMPGVHIGRGAIIGANSVVTKDIPDYSVAGCQEPLIMGKDAEGNVADRGVMLSNTTGCIVRKPAEKLAVVDGLDDYIVIDTDDVLLVYPKSKEQEIKQITNRLQFEGGEKYL